MLSVIIPTLNEEKNIEALLSSLLSDKMNSVELVVADGGSKDRTIEIAKKYGAKIVDGGTPAEGRNLGAAAAEGDVLLFLDADLKLPEHFLKNSLAEFEEKEMDIASYHLYPIKGKLLLNRFTINLFYNYQQHVFSRSFPMGAMGIMVRKTIFDKVGGFDETIKLAEDVHFVQQAAKIGKFGIIHSTRIYMPTRRFDRDGYFRTGWTYLMCALHMACKGPVRKSSYRFNHYEENNKG
ncbi:MAG: glycosyltransferase [Candidatus Pacebacteria bacterium]|nr:glycosyltransferase [Candidatus Paceibacterota bacterium]